MIVWRIKQKMRAVLYSVVYTAGHISVVVLLVLVLFSQYQSRD